MIDYDIIDKVQTIYGVQKVKNLTKLNFGISHIGKQTGDRDEAKENSGGMFGKF